MQRTCHGAGGQPQSTFKEERRHLLCPALVQAFPFSRLLLSLQEASARVVCKGKGRAAHGTDWGRCPKAKEGLRSHRPISGACHLLPCCMDRACHTALLLRMTVIWGRLGTLSCRTPESRYFLPE